MDDAEREELEEMEKSFTRALESLAGNDSSKALADVSALLVWAGEKLLGIKLDPGTYFVANLMSALNERGIDPFQVVDRADVKAQVLRMREAAGITVINLNEEGK